MGYYSFELLYTPVGYMSIIAVRVTYKSSKIVFVCHFELIKTVSLAKPFALIYISLA